MTRSEFKAALKRNRISAERFAVLIGRSVSSVYAYGSTAPIPRFVRLIIRLLDERGGVSGLVSDDGVLKSDGQWFCFYDNSRDSPVSVCDILHMSTISRSTAIAQRDATLADLEAARKSLSVSHTDRAVTRQKILDLEKHLEFWERRIMVIDRSGSAKVRRTVIHD